MYAQITIPACAGCCRCGLTGETVDLVLSGVTICPCIFGGGIILPATASLVFSAPSGINAAHTLTADSTTTWSLSGIGSVAWSLINTTDCSLGSVIDSGTTTFEITVECLDDAIIVIAWITGFSSSAGGGYVISRFPILAVADSPLDTPTSDPNGFGDCQTAPDFPGGYGGTSTVSNP